MKVNMTNAQIQSFLNDFQMNSEVKILEEGKEKNELEQIAEARGIKIKGSRDLAIFKTIYAFTDKANSNGAILPKQELLRVLPQIVGKPININHNRRMIVGTYIDYRYKQKQNQVMAYGIFYKSAFADEWLEATKLFKKKKLSSSFEIWSPSNKRKYKENGDYELFGMEIAGGALIYEDEDNSPAFKDAKVLSLAKDQMESKLELIYSSKYKEEDMIISEKIKSESTEQPPTSEIIPKVRCSNCGEEFESAEITNIKCPKCKAILNKNGDMLYPPQIQDFKLLCLFCKTNNWLILSKQENKLNIRCMNCSKEYAIEYLNKVVHPILEKTPFLYMSYVNCVQCNNRILIAGQSTDKNREIICDKCGLIFHNHTSETRYKTISKIIERDNAVEKSSKGGKDNMKFKIETSKFHRYIENEEDLTKVLNEMDMLDVAKDEKVKNLTTEHRKALPDNLFAVVVRVKNKKTGKTNKIRMFPIHDEVHVRNALARLGQEAPQVTLKRLGVNIESVKTKILKRAKQLKMADLLKRQEKASKENSKIEDVSTSKNEVKLGEEIVEKTLTSASDKVTITKSNQAIENAVTKVVILKKQLNDKNTKSEEIISLYKSGMKKLVSKISTLRNDLEIAKKDNELLKSSAKEIINRREILGEEWSKDLSDEQIMNDDKFELNKAKKELADTKAKVSSENESGEIVADKSVDSEYKKIALEINKKAFPTK